jgi:4-diphosphocytidyl-2-C-methyl-D-erythritol kinase
MRGIGELLSPPIELPALPALLVNPGVAVATRDVFGRLAGTQNQSGLTDVPRNTDALIEYLKQHGNDLTAPATACAPVIAEVLAALRATAGVRLTRMSGSGSTCFALFRSSNEAAKAAQRLKAERTDWWICHTTIGLVAKS